MIEEIPYALMERAWKIMRKSISTFLSHFEYFTTIPVLLMLPFSASVLVSQALSLGSSQTKSNDMFIMANNKTTYFTTSQTLFPSIIVLPFYLSSLLISKACVIKVLKDPISSPKDPISSPKNSNTVILFSCLSLYKPLLKTQLYNMVFSISINTASMFIISTIASSSYLEGFGFFQNMVKTILGLVFYAIVTNTAVLCNLSTTVSGLEKNSTTHEAMQKAFLLRKLGSNSIAMLLALPTSIGLASIEALFCFRVVRVYSKIRSYGMCMILEATLIAYLYSVIVVLDTISCCLFLQSCGLDTSIGNPNNYLSDQVELV